MRLHVLSINLSTWIFLLSCSESRRLPACGHCGRRHKLPVTMFMSLAGGEREGLHD
jgi:hypothetical protein